LPEQHLLIGKISDVFGVKGWVKVFSYTADRKNILDYSPWILQKGEQKKAFDVVSGRSQGKAIVACLEGIDNRNDAGLLTGWDIFIDASQLPPAGQNEYYWSDLVGLEVETTAGFNLGIVDHLIETGANDVLVVAGDRERLIPFLQQQAVINIDLETGVMIVDWDPEF
jgi:16S rRNA processing protein RimM